MTMRRSSSLLLRALANDAAAPRLLFTRVAGFKSWSHLSNNDRSWPSPDGGSGAASGPAYPETGSTSSRDLDGSGQAKPAGGDDKFVSGSSKPGTGRTWPNPNAPRDIPTYTPSSYSSSSKGGGKLWDNPNGLPYWDSKWDDPTKPELRAKGWTWDPNPANSHMGTWPADQPPPNRSPLGFGTPRGGSTWNRGGGGGGAWNQGGGGGGGNWNQGGGGGGNWNQGGGGAGFNQGGGPGGGGFPGGNQQGGAPGGGGFPGGNQQGGAPGGGGFPGGNQQGGGGFPSGNQQGGAPGGGGFPGGNQQGGGAAPAGGGFPGGNNGFNR